MKMQEAFEKVIEHQRRQGQPCTATHGRYSQYAVGDMRCAIGCMMTLEECQLYDSGDDPSVCDLYFNKAEPSALHLSDADRDTESSFWQWMQDTHDRKAHWEPDKWLAECEARWQTIAQEFDLKYPVVITERESRYDL